MRKKIVKKAKMVSKAKTHVKAKKAKIVKKTVAPVAKKIMAISKPLSKVGLIRTIADMSAMPKKAVSATLSSLMSVMQLHLKKRGPGEFTLPGIAKFRVVNKPATKARHGINPFTGKPTVFAAKPARSVVKVRALKKVKDMTA